MLETCTHATHTRRTFYHSSSSSSSLIWLCSFASEMIVWIRFLSFWYEQQQQQQNIHLSFKISSILFCQSNEVSPFTQWSNFIRFTFVFVPFHSIRIPFILFSLYSDHRPRTFEEELLLAVLSNQVDTFVLWATQCELDENIKYIVALIPFQFDWQFTFQYMDRNDNDFWAKGMKIDWISFSPCVQTNVCVCVGTCLCLF